MLIWAVLVQTVLDNKLSSENTGSMKQVYILIPLLTYTNQRLQAQLDKILNLSPDQYEIHDISDDKLAVQLINVPLGYAELTEILENYEKQRQKLLILESQLREYDWHEHNSSIQASSIDSLLKKAGKYKEVKEENKKLKQLLQNQLENTEKVREETQKTMRVLREEFDNLVKEMGKQGAEKDKKGRRMIAVE